MPRLNIIVLQQTAGDPNGFELLFWADVPSARQTYYANSNAKSAWAQATTTDNQNLQNGSVVEQATSAHYVPGTPLVQIEQEMQQRWQVFQNNITNNNPWIRYGSTWDGATWTILSNP
jgi:hypothetical protein